MKIFFFFILKVTEESSRPESISQSLDPEPDPHQNVTDPTTVLMETLII